MNLTKEGVIGFYIGLALPAMVAVLMGADDWIIKTLFVVGPLLGFFVGSMFSKVRNKD